MARLLRFSVLALLASPFIGIMYIMFLRSPPPLPYIDAEEWWGPEELEAKQDTSVRPFEVEFSPSMIQDLKKRLKNHRNWTPPLEDIGFQYGFNSKQLDSWIIYWAEKYDFKARERFFNKFPQFKTNIQGLDIHFIRVRPEVSTGTEVVPMLFLHTWPGSVREFYEALPLLTAVSKHQDFAIEAIVPSWPGSGFSDEVLGFHTNVGATASSSAVLLNLLGAWLPSFVVESHLADRMYPISSTFGFLLEESGYVHHQATKPDTLGIAMSDSPVALLAYILEKFSTWTKKEHKLLTDGGLNEVWTKDKLLDNIMCYWSTHSFSTSVRLYAEYFNKRHVGLQLDEIPTPVPTWVVQAKNELIFQPSRILRTKFPNLVHANPIAEGGHFLAFELPDVFSEDVLNAVTAFRKLKSEERTEL